MGAHVTGGDVVGIVDESILIKHKIMVPPNVSSSKIFLLSFRNSKTDEVQMCGTITWLATEGSYTVTDALIEVEFAGELKKSSMMQVLYKCLTEVSNTK